MDWILDGSERSFVWDDVIIVTCGVGINVQWSAFLTYLHGARGIPEGLC